MHLFRFPSIGVALVVASSVFVCAYAQTKPIELVADLSEAPRKIYRADVELPVKAGALTLTTPQWIPGNHRPTGPVIDYGGGVFDWRQADRVAAR